MYNHNRYTLYWYEGGPDMPDYAKMYKTLFQAQTQAIEILQKAQQDTEEIYISSRDPEIRVLRPEEPEDKKPDDEK